MRIIDRLLGTGATKPLDAARLEKLVRGCEVQQIVAQLAPLDEGQRRALAPAVADWVKAFGSDHSWTFKSVPALVVAAVGCLPSAAQAATVLSRRQVNWQSSGDLDAAATVRVARDRGIAWLGDLGLRLADKLDRDGGAWAWGFVAELLRVEGVAAPAHERFLRGWLRHQQMLDHGQRRRPILDALRADPWLDRLALPAFDIDDITFGGWHDGQWSNEPVVLLAIAQLVREKRLDRAAVLDGCLAVFTSGRRVGVLRGFARLHDDLSPTVAEIAERRALYVRLLADGPGQVASLSQKALRAVDEAGELEFDTLLAASRAVLNRAEKGLVKAQLVWLGRLVRRVPTRAGEVADVVADALAHPAVEIRDRAAAFVTKHGRAPVAVVEPVRVLVDALGPPVPAAAMPAPIASADELAEELVQLDVAPWQVASFERVLAGLVLMSAADPDGLRAAVAPVFGRFRQRLFVHEWSPYGLTEVRSLLLDVVRHVAGERVDRAHAAKVLRTPPRDARSAQPQTKPQGVIELRLAELAVRLPQASVPALVSTPTWVNGLLDPAELVERLAKAERDGWQPWHRDLDQALYRLPTGVSDDVIARARALSTPAAVRFVAWAEARSVPVMSLEPVDRDPSTSRPWLIRLQPDRAIALGKQPTDSDVRDPFGLFDVSVSALGQHSRTAIDWLRLWPGVVPAHREVVAAYLLPHLAGLRDYELRGHGQLLPLLADCTGAAGRAACMALGYGLAARRDADRVAALDAMLAMLATGDLDAGTLGAEIGQLTAADHITFGRLLAPLRDAAQVAPAAVWRLVSAALPHLLLWMSPAPRGLPDLLTLGAETAAVVGARGSVPGLAEVAARGRGSRLVVEARRLQAALAAPPSTGTPPSEAEAG